jgi:hypothetical protein
MELIQIIFFLSMISMSKTHLKQVPIEFIELTRY